MGFSGNFGSLPDIKWEKKFWVDHTVHEKFALKPALRKGRK